MKVKKLFTIAGAVFFSIVTMAQSQKVAVFDPEGDANTNLKEIVREEVSSIIVNQGGYTVLERALINKVLEENKFQMSGLVDDAQISEIGKRLGADLVFVSNITAIGSNYYISCKLIDVKTARIEKQKTATTQSGANDFVPVIQKMVTDMFGVRQVVTENKFINSYVPLVAHGNKVYQSGRLLSQYEASAILATTNMAQQYNEGLTRSKVGNYLLMGGGVALGIGGLMLMISEKVEVMYLPGSALCTLSVPASITGLILKPKGKKLIDEAIQTHNQKSGSTSSVNFNFGITPRGMGVVLNF